MRAMKRSDGCTPMKIMGHKLAGVLRPFHPNAKSAGFYCSGLIHTGSKIGIIISRLRESHWLCHSFCISITFPQGKEFLYVRNYSIINSLFRMKVENICQRDPFV